MINTQQRNFTIYHSNHLDILKDLLIHLMQSAPLHNPFNREQIIVQSQGMEQWLKQEIAKAFDISANIAFPYPSSFVWEQYTLLLDSIPEKNPLTRDKMRWKIMQVLADELDRPEFASLKYYLKDDAQGIKGLQLAEKIAEIYDQYLVFRPQWIDEWEAGNDQTAASQPWQPILWRKIISSFKSSCHRASIFRQFENLLSNKDQGKSPEAKINVSLLPSRIFVFGVSAIPPQYLRVLELLSVHCPVHLFFHNPCGQYWIDLVDKKTQAKRALTRLTRQRISMDQYGDFNFADEPQQLMEDDANNSLLASMGQLGQDFYKQLLALEVREIEAFAAYGWESRGNDNNNNNNNGNGNGREKNSSSMTLLAQVQNDVLNLHEPTAVKLELSASDRLLPSIVFHSCHSPVREIEILHDQLLDLFSKNTALTPKDIVVMIPNIDEYSPFIQAVFERFEKTDNRYIPFSISDRSVTTENPIISSFLQLIKLPQSRCTANELLAILEVPAVLKQFQLSAQDLPVMRRWIKDTGIRWGLNNKDSELFELPQLETNHWSFGLQRMFAGYAMPESIGLYYGQHEDILPYDGIEGADAELLGKLAFYIETITEYRRRLHGSYSITAWQQLLRRLIEDFYIEDQQSSKTLIQIFECLAELEEEILEAMPESEKAEKNQVEAEHAALDHKDSACPPGALDEIQQVLMVKLIESSLQAQTSSQKFLSGKVNFCSLMPMRAIPFKVVCLLGMNDGVFPSNRVHQSFDLMTSSHITGDRSHRDDERYMFLEAVLSARQQLYISYIGRNINDNSEKIPSVLVTELQTYCEQRFKLTEDRSILSHLIMEHPLQPFSQQYYNPAEPPGANRLFSYVHEWLSGQEQKTVIEPAQTHTLGDDSQELISSVSLEQLIRFYANPCQYYLNQSQHVYFTENTEELEESEAFQLDGLQYYQLKMDLLNWHELFPQDKSYIEFKERELNRGHLGYHLTAEKHIDKAIDDVNDILNRSEQYKTVYPGIKRSLLSIKLTLPSGIQLETEPFPVLAAGPECASSIIDSRPAKSSAKIKLQLWLKHLMICAADQKQKYHLPEGKEFRTVCINTDLSLIYEPVTQPQAKAYLQTLVEIYQQGLGEPLAFFPETSFSFIVEGRTEAMKKFYGGYNSPGEIENAYIQRCYTDFDSIPLQQLETIARHVYQPMKVYLKEVKDDFVYLQEHCL